MLNIINQTFIIIDLKSKISKFETNNLYNLKNIF